MFPGRLRLFVAVLAPPAVRAAVARGVREPSTLTPNGSVRWTASDTAHVTLQFLGGTDPGRVDELSEAIHLVVATRTTFELQTAGFGAFPSRARPRVVWLALTGDTPALGALHAAVTAATGSLGFATEPGPFTPHLALGRVRDRASRPHLRALSGALHDCAPPPPARWVVDQVHLMASETRPEGARHTTVARWPLREPR